MARTTLKIYRKLHGLLNQKEARELLGIEREYHFLQFLKTMNLHLKPDIEGYASKGWTKQEITDAYARYQKLVNR